MAVQLTFLFLIDKNLHNLFIKSELKNFKCFFLILRFHSSIDIIKKISLFKPSKNCIFNYKKSKCL